MVAVDEHARLLDYSHPTRAGNCQPHQSGPDSVAAAVEVQVEAVEAHIPEERIAMLAVGRVTESCYIALVGARRTADAEVETLAGSC